METTRIARHMSVDEVKMKMQMTAGFLRMQKWLVIYNAIIDPRPMAEIAKHTGLSEASVCRIIAEYNTAGPESVEPFIKSDDPSRFGRGTQPISG